MRKALYRHYRPKKLADVVGQEHITITLKNALASSSFSHAYLFTGPRGVGKTSVARILAHEINGLKYEDDQTHLDIIEIDAASNRRIDEIRDLRDKVNIAPSSARFKVYIIDEVHMLTREAFNALLKTLEEPPAHVVFILATTEAHKVPETISSRTQKFSFRAVNEEALAKHLKGIAEKEKIEVGPEALKLIAEHGSGSFRDSIGLLDQLSGSKQLITAELVRKMIGLPAEDRANKVIEALINSDAGLMLSELQSLRAEGVSPGLTAKMIADKLRQQILNPEFGLRRQQSLPIIESLLLVPTFADQAAALEIALLKHVVIQNPTATSLPAAKIVTTVTVKPVKPAPKQSTKAIDVNKTWSKVLSDTKSAHNTLYSVLRMAQVRSDGNDLFLGFKFPFHVKQVSQERNLSKIYELVKANFGESVIVHIDVSEDYEEPSYTQPSAPETNLAEQPPSDVAVANISNIFGNAELLD